MTKLSEVASYCQPTVDSTGSAGRYVWLRCRCWLPGCQRFSRVSVAIDQVTDHLLEFLTELIGIDILPYLLLKGDQIRRHFQPALPYLLRHLRFHRLLAGRDKIPRAALH